jgi:hypothetical protein
MMHKLPIDSNAVEGRFSHQRRLKRIAGMTIRCVSISFAMLCMGWMAWQAGPSASPSTAWAAETIRTIRVPDGGIQPQAAVDARGLLHLIYFAGDAAAGDLYYATSADGGESFSRSLRVNSRPHSAVAVGNIRGAHLALGRNGRVHVAWMGAGEAEPKAPGGEQPMLYTRLKADGSGFEAQRNVIAKRVGLDGGGSIAADGEGNVYVVWHARGDERGEENRKVWVAVSHDDGATFEAEIAANTQPTGVCPCCGLRAFADSRGKLHILYRGATEEVNRDMYLLTSQDQGRTFSSRKLDDWQIGHCMMSSSALAEGPKGVLAAWETEEQIHFAPLIASNDSDGSLITAPGKTPQRKHPAIAVNSRGEILLAWTERMSWKKGGAVAWQVFAADGRALPGRNGTLEGVPAWSLVSAFITRDGEFGVVY